MPTDKNIFNGKELKREEIRAIFAIGVIASLIAVRPLIAEMPQEPVFLGWFTLLWLLDFIIVTWVIYIFSMSIGISEDLFGNIIATVCAGIGVLAFIIGAGGVILIFVFSFWEIVALFAIPVIIYQIIKKVLYPEIKRLIPKIRIYYSKIQHKMKTLIR